MSVQSLGLESELLYQALAEPIGLVIKCLDFEAFRTRLYKIKSTLADPDLACLQFRRSPFVEGNLIITKYQVEPKRAAPIRAAPISDSELKFPL